ncbi:glycoside hydrolase family 3 protein [Colletotrichum musicola]|uniref:Glycoside hydrolase family 3 protein n=1 Tax=Colletotrichum musicola TaxID=2175873 RepID=A0A8H6NJH8_9PEZI|nr:glycoside hydrolase family 3 protein [Colletotrichum musicola]
MRLWASEKVGSAANNYCRAPGFRSSAEDAWEDVGFAFNKDVITGLLMNELLRLASRSRQPYGSNYAAVVIRNGTLEFNAMERASALLGSYGRGPEAFLDVASRADGWAPEGRLPFDMSRSMEVMESLSRTS